MTTPPQPGITPQDRPNEDDDPDAERIEARAARQLPEEAAAGSEDATKQAAAILAESEARTVAGDGGAVERRTSEDTVPPIQEDR